MDLSDADRPPAAAPPAVTLESALSASAEVAAGDIDPDVRLGRRRPWGLRAGLLGMLAIGLVPAVAGTAMYITHLRDIALRDAYDQAILLAGGTSERLRWLLQDAQAMLTSVASRPQVVAADPRDCDPVFQDFRDLSPAFRALSLRRLDGSSVCSELAQPPTQQRVAAAPWFQAAVRHGGLYVSDVHVGNVTGAWTARITYPVVGGRGEATGILITPVNLQQLQQRLFADVPPGAQAAVIDASNRVVVRSVRQDERVGKPAAAGVVREIEALRRERAATPGDAPLTRTFSEIGIDDQPRLFAIRTVPLSGWTVVAGLDEDATLEGYRVTRNRALAAIVGVLALVALAAWRVSRGILVPIDGLARAARGVAAGDNSRRAPLAGPHEIREVAREFNRMVVATDQSAQRLRASESHYRTLIQNLPVAVVAHRTDTSIEVFNHRACSLLRMTHEQMQGRMALDRAWWFVDADGRRLPPSEYPVSRVLQTRAPMQAEVLGIVSEGDSRPLAGDTEPLAGPAPAPHTWVMVTAYPQFDTAGQLVRVVVVFVDVTLQRHHEELRLAKEKAESASRAKTAFLSRVSHELRTPLNAINGFSELMLTDPAAPPATRTGAQHILDAGRHLLSLINQILDLTRIETGQTEVALRPLPLLPVLEDCLTICRPLADARGIELDLVPVDPAEVDGDPRTVLWVNGDPTPLRQIVINLASNGIKYNRPGGRVLLRVLRPEPDAVDVVVEDTGRGLTGEQIASLFQPFNRLGAEHSGIEGHGLGLAISRALAQVLGGDITVESESGRGSRFTLRLQAATAARPGGPDA